MNTLKIAPLYPDSIIPQYQSLGAAGFDLHARIDHPEEKKIDLTLWKDPIIGTGIAVEVPVGFVMLIIVRSGLGFKHNTRLANCVGVIDSDYRGEVKVKLYSDNKANCATIVNGDRIAQALILPAPQYIIETVKLEDLGKTERGAGGFGSTGVNDKARDDPFGASGKHGHRLSAADVQREIEAGNYRYPQG